MPWLVGARLAIFVAGWTLMSIVMMLPSSLPLVTGFHAMMRRGSVSLLLGGYFCVWALFGAAFFADAVLHELLEAILGSSQRPDLIAPSLLLAAGFFQLSPLKYACPKHCRSPLGFLIQRWRGGRRALRFFTVGMQHRVFCIGRCWGLMLLMFGVGGIHLSWMLVLGVIMFLEKALTWGRWITRAAEGSSPCGDWRSCSEFWVRRRYSDGSGAARFAAVADFPSP